MDAAFWGFRGFFSFLCIECLQKHLVLNKPFLAPTLLASTVLPVFSVQGRKGLVSATFLYLLFLPSLAQPKSESSAANPLKQHTFNG